LKLCVEMRVRKIKRFELAIAAWIILGMTIDAVRCDES